MKKLFVKGMRHGIPIMLGYLSVSFGFGVLCIQKNLSILAAVGISVTNLTLKTTLFNATGTMNSYYDALVRHEQRRKYDWMDDLDG